MLQRGTSEVRDGIGEVRDGIEDMRVLLRQLSAHRITQNLRKWLKAPDATTNLNETLKNNHKDTGPWLVLSMTFKAWLGKSGSFLWLVGFAGCGKYVLCSTAIKYGSSRITVELGETLQAKA